MRHIPNQVQGLHEGPKRRGFHARHPPSKLLVGNAEKAREPGLAAQQLGRCPQCVGVSLSALVHRLRAATGVPGFALASRNAGLPLLLERVDDPRGLRRPPSLAARMDIAMSEATVRLLQAAVDILGDERILAERLEIDEPLLKAFMEDRRSLPDSLLLKTVDIVLSATSELEAGRPPRGTSTRRPR